MRLCEVNYNEGILNLFTDDVAQLVYDTLQLLLNAHTHKDLVMTRIIVIGIHT